MKRTGCLATVAPCLSKTILNGEEGASRGGCEVCLKGDIKVQNCGDQPGMLWQTRSRKCYHMELIAMSMEASESIALLVLWREGIDLDK
jgi:hypothetical protein